MFATVNRGIFGAGSDALRFDEQTAMERAKQRVMRIGRFTGFH
jgi:hypothetical protein